MKVKKIGVFVVLLALFVGACSRHDDPPPQAPIIQPPVPANLTVTPTDTTATRFDLRWDISDPTVVSHYRVYLVDPFFGTTFLDTSDATAVQVITGVTLLQIVFGVTSVTIENVEGSMATATYISGPAPTSPIHRHEKP